MNISKARSITGYEKVPYEEYCDGGSCYYCKEKYTRFNSMNELRTSYEYDEYNEACMISMAKARESGMDLIVGLF